MTQKFQFPNLNWFEFEILTQLMVQKKYGNEILLELNCKFGPGSISSGKLYPALQKLEKKHYIKRVKEKKKAEGVIRGVDRVYFTLTADGKKELEKATFYSSSSLINGLMFQLQMEVMIRSHDIITSSLEEPHNVGLVLRSPAQVAESILGRYKPLTKFKFFAFELGGELELDKTVKSVLGGIDITFIPTKEDDFPLKANYLDAVVLVMALHSHDNWEPLLKESTRILKPGGILMILDFAKFDSYILEAMMRHVLIWKKDPPEDMGLDREKVIDSLKPYIKNIKTEKMKEIILIYGKKTS
jgi:DNA-binding PadR family transcriptional regulator